MHDLLVQAATLIGHASALLVTAGAGMSADSGLPTFRDEGGLWRIHTPLEIAGVTPNSFDRDPAAAWGFYATRRQHCLRTTPHAGFSALRRWVGRVRDGYFVYTSNVDEHFQRAGFDEGRLVECHGTLSATQCMERCCEEVFPLAEALQLNAETGRVEGPLPQCPRCGGLARPNVLLFYDFSWVSRRMNEQHDRMESWLEALPSGKSLVVLEIGAGTAVPTVRVCGEDVARRHHAPLIRINPGEAALEDIPGVSLELPALQALLALDEEVGTPGCGSSSSEMGHGS